MRLCDGCLVVVDVIEGVCTQTLTVLKQAFQEGVKPILIINKIDRLILHLKQSPLSAYQQIRNIIEKVNAYISSLYTAEVISNTATTVFVPFFASSTVVHYRQQEGGATVRVSRKRNCSLRQCCPRYVLEMAMRI